MSLPFVFRLLTSASAGRWYLLISLGLLIFIWLLRLSRRLAKHFHHHSLESIIPSLEPNHSEILNPEIFVPPYIPKFKLPFFWILNFILIGIFLATTSIIFARPPQVISPFVPISQPITITKDQPLVIQFDRPIDITTLAYLTPGVPGQWLFKSQNHLGLVDQLVFQPAQPLETNTEYFVYLKDIRPLLSLTKAHDYLFLLPTNESLALINQDPESAHSNDAPTGASPTPEPTIAPPALETPQEPAPTATISPNSALQNFSIPVPLYKQHHKFTCFSAASQMVLGFYGVQIGELEFSNLVGYDSSSRNHLTNTWGNPNHAIVGTYDGSGPGGYGAHWEPVARVINKYRPTEIKRQWNIPDLLKEVEAKHPVMVWWVNGVWPAKDVSWNTSSGERVYTVNGMHVEVVVGWEGPRDNPTRILTNDPWRGRRRYTSDTFKNLWKWFDNTAVIVR